MRRFLVAGFLLLALFCGGCTSRWHIKQAIKKGGEITRDTVFKEVPVFLTETKADTTFISRPADTVVLHKDRLKLKYVRFTGDTVFLSGECAADTVFQKVPVVVTQKIQAGRGSPWWVWAVIGFLCLVVLRLCFKR